MCLTKDVVPVFHFSCNSSLILKNVIKLMDLLYFAFQFYLNLRLAAFVCHFFKFNANLVMFTTINIYETILNKYYVHHILKICIYTGMTATAKFVLCHTRQHLNLPKVTSSYCYIIECHSDEHSTVGVLSTWWHFLM